MKLEIIKARWTINGIGVPYADYFSVLLFTDHIKLLAMHAEITDIKFSFKSNPEQTKKKYNYKFNF